MYVAGEGVVHVGEILVDDSNDLVFPVVGHGVCLCGRGINEVLCVGGILSLSAISLTFSVWLCQLWRLFLDSVSESPSAPPTPTPLQPSL